MENLQAIPEFSDLAKNFPLKDNAWPTVLLNGRDCLPAQMQEQSRMGCSDQLMAVKTPLGWALVGKTSPSINERRACMINTKQKSHKKAVRRPSSPPKNATPTHPATGEKSYRNKASYLANTREMKTPQPQLPTIYERTEVLDQQNTRPINEVWTPETTHTVQISRNPPGEEVQDSTTPNGSHAPAPTEITTSATTSTNIEEFCAWCHIPYRQHDHDCDECERFVNDLVSIKWALVEQYQLCQICLKVKQSDHLCLGKKKQCLRCLQTHHKVLGCAPTPLNTVLSTESTPVFDNDSCSVSPTIQLHSPSASGTTVGTTLT